MILLGKKKKVEIGSEKQIKNLPRCIINHTVMVCPARWNERERIKSMIEISMPAVNSGESDKNFKK